MDKLRLRFEKTGRAVYISHLDLMRMWQRAFFRAGLPLRYSEGFNPHARLSIVMPLGVGVSSHCEYLDFFLTREENLSALPERLNACLPEGVRALEAYAAEEKGAELKWVRLRGSFSGGRDAAFYREFFARESIPVLRRTKRGESDDDLAPYIKDAVFTDGDGALQAELVLRAQEPSIRPELLMQALGEDAPGFWRLERVAAYREDMSPFR